MSKRAILANKWDFQRSLGNKWSCPIKMAAEKTPHLSAVITDERTLSYLELDTSIQKVCRLLDQEGVHENQKIAFIARTNSQTILLLFALWRLGATACPLSFRLPEAQIKNALTQLQADRLFCIDELQWEHLAPLNLSKTIDEKTLATFLFTSGSTAAPKIAANSLGNYFHSALGTIEQLPLLEKSRWLLSLPLFHVGGLAILFRCFLSASSVVLSEKPVIQTCIDHKITHLSLVPTQLYRLLNTSPLYIKQIASMLQGVLLGGSALSEALLKKALQSGLKVIPTYGMTEMSSQITMDRVLSYDGPVTAGTPLPGVEIKLSEDQEILVRGKNLFQGYWDVETQSLMQPLTSDGWFATKDLGAWTPDGKLQLIGRKDNLFISGGENIQPEEIEAILCKFPGIVQALVVPIPDAEFGARPIAFIQTDGPQLPLNQIQAFLKPHLPSYKIPIEVRLIPKEFLEKEMKLKRRELLVVRN